MQVMRETVQSGHESVCGVGLGTSGVPTAEFFLGRGIPADGCDLDPIALERLSPRLIGRATALAALPRTAVCIVTGPRRSSAIPSVAIETLPSTLIPAPKGPSGRTDQGTHPMSFSRFGRPSNSPSQTSDSTRKSGVVSRPCHSLASLKYSFWAAHRYGLGRARCLWGRHHDSDSC